MASFESVLQIKGKEYNVLYSDFDIHQYTDSLGRPASPTFGGVYTLDIEAPPSGDSTLYEWMVEPGLFLNGQVLIKNLSSRTNLKVIKFYNAYCVDLEQHFDGTGLSGGERSLRLSLRVSPQAVNINGLMHDNDWPAPEPIVDWDWTEMDAACHPERQTKEEPSALSEGLHTLLDVVGMIPVVGEVADAANALIYAAEGDYTNAALSAASMIPLAGNVVGAAKLAKRGVKLAQKAAKLIPPKLVKKLDEGVANIKKVLEKDPVDVATGMMLTQSVDFELPGPIPLVWERVWYSASDYQGPLGYGWYHRYNMGLTLDAETNVAVLRLAEGRQIAFALPLSANQPVFDRASGLTFYQPAPDDPVGMPWRVWDQGQQVWYVFAAPPTNGAYQPLYAIANITGQRIQFGYSDEGRLEQITDSANRLLTLTYDERGLIQGVYGPDPNQSDAQIQLAGYNYDRAGDLVTYTDAEGNRWQYRYSKRLLVQTTTPTGLSFYWEYEGVGPDARCVHTWGDGGIHEGRFAYVDDHTTLMTDSDGTTRYTHQGGLVTYKVDALGAECHYDYNEYDELVAETDPLGAVTRYGYDGGGNRIWTQYPDNARVQTSYDEQDRVIAYTDARGNTWDYDYNERGLLARQINPLGATTEYTYDEKGRLVTVINALEQATQLSYDEQHQIAHIVTPDEQIRSRNYDALGRVVKLTDPTGAVQQREYDRMGRLVRLIEADGSEQALVYDDEGNVLEARQGEQVINFVYTGAGRLAERRQASQRVHFSYDREGRLIGLTNEADEQYRFELDVLGQVVTEIGFDGLTRRYERDAAGRITKVLRPADRSTEYSYDAGGRVSKVRYSDGHIEKYVYDAEGDLIEATNSAMTVRFVRDRMGRINQETQGKHTVDYEYNALGQRTYVKSSMGANLTLDYDALGNVAKMQTESWIASFGYDSRGLEIHRQLSGNVDSQWAYNSLGRPVSELINRKSGSSRQRIYQWRQEDHLSQIKDSLAGDSTYDYDLVGNLIAAHYTNGQPEIRVVDKVGNLFEQVDRSDRHYRAGGQLQTAGANQYVYDEEGNLIQKITSKEQWQYRWSDSGMLREVIRPDEVSVHFDYDALGRRVSKRYKGKVTRWLWDGDKPLHEWQEFELDGHNTEDVITWLFDEDSFAPIAKLQGNARYSILTDHLGTPLEMVDQAGFTQWAAQTTSYGRVRLSVGTRTECPFRFQGQYEDVETGLYYNRFRYYAPEEGIYISQDPIGLAGGSALYGYVWDPNQYVDVLGLSAGSTALDKALGGIVGDGKMAHHLIPELTWNANAAFLDSIGIPRSLRDAASNGLLIVSSRPTPVPGKRTQIYHSTRHRQYTDKVVDKLSRIKDRYDVGLITDAQAKQQVESLQKSLRKKIQNATISTKMPCGRLA